MLSNRGLLQSIEGVCKDLLLKLGCTEAAYRTFANRDEGRKWLVKRAISALQKLASGKSPVEPDERSHPDIPDTPGSPANALALSLEGDPDAEAVAAFCKAGRIDTRGA